MCDALQQKLAELLKGDDVDVDERQNAHEETSGDLQLSSAVQSVLEESLVFMESNNTSKMLI